jgi:hypothetical protein
MIWESEYWKTPLLKSSKYLRGVRLTESTTERTFVRIEKEVFIGFYSVRKLLDTYKISDDTKKLSFDLIWYKNKKPIHYMNWYEIGKMYDLKNVNRETRNIRFVCNQFIHSYIFVPKENNHRLDGFFVASDKERNKKCYYIELENVLSIFRAVGKNYPANFSYSYNNKTGEYDYSTW